MTETWFIGIDVGTSGVRAALIDADGNIKNSAKSAMDEHGANRRDPETWWGATDAVLKALSIDVTVTGICVDGTSGTVLPIDDAGNPLGDALMYNDAITDSEVLQKIADIAPATSAVHGASSALARAIVLQRTPGVVRIIHQADWIAGKLSARFDVSDESNALKTGYDPISRQWPEWIDQTGMSPQLLPTVVPAGSVTGQIAEPVAKQYNLSPDTSLVAGVSDGCASFLATGASNVGDCVTALGSTITMKMLCDQPLFSPEFGVYSHRIGDRWLAGGASNSGGNVLANYFSDNELSRLSDLISPEQKAMHTYYPLLTAGERFPHNDAQWQPCVEPRPDKDEDFLHCLLEGMAGIETLGYQRLKELGAPEVRSMRTVGGGASNEVWGAIRQRLLQASFENSVSTEAAVGVALLARDAFKETND